MSAWWASKGALVFVFAAGTASGGVLAVTIGMLNERGTGEPAPEIDAREQTNQGRHAELLAAIRSLTQSVQRLELVPISDQVQPTDRAPVSALDAPGVSELLEELDQRLASSDTSLRLGVGVDPGVIENARRAEIRGGDVQAAVDALYDDRAALEKSLFLRTVGYAIERFGFPSEILTFDNGFHGYWTLDEKKGLSIKFVDGFILEVDGHDLGRH